MSNILVQNQTVNFQLSKRTFDFRIALRHGKLYLYENSPPPTRRLGAFAIA